MILAKDDIEKAVSWWAGKLMDHQPHYLCCSVLPCGYDATERYAGSAEHIQGGIGKKH